MTSWGVNEYNVGFRKGDLVIRLEGDYMGGDHMGGDYMGGVIIWASFLYRFSPL